MNFNIITNTVKNKISNLQTADQKRTLKISDIVLIPEFEKMLAMDESVIAAMTDSMKNEDFKPGHELHIRHRDGKYILIDGHIHRHCAMKAGLTSVPHVSFIILKLWTKQRSMQSMNRRIVEIFRRGGLCSRP